MLGGGLVGFAGSGLFLVWRNWHGFLELMARLGFPVSGFPTSWRECSILRALAIAVAKMNLEICSLAAIFGAVLGILIGKWIPKIVIVVTVVIYALLIASFTTN